MTEETQDSAPGSGAGDAAPTQHIPHIAKPPKNASRRSGTGAKAPAATTVSSQTDKGRVREPVSLDLDVPEDAVADTPDTDPRLTADDYARTTKGSPASTAVIPAVKDAPAEHAAAPPADERSGRQASLRLNHIEPWSVTRIAFAVSVALMIVGVVAVTIFWVVLSITGVWGQVNDSITSVLSDDSSSFDITDYLGFWRLVGLTLVLSAINVVLMTALATIGAHLYNLAAQLLGGIEVTFGEDH